MFYVVLHISLFYFILEFTFVWQCYVKPNLSIHKWYFFIQFTLLKIFKKKNILQGFFGGSISTAWTITMEYRQKCSKLRTELKSVNLLFLDPSWDPAPGYCDECAEEAWWAECLPRLCDPGRPRVLLWAGAGAIGLMQKKKLWTDLSTFVTTF